jgi:hypothetical protein
VLSLLSRVQYPFKHAVLHLATMSLSASLYNLEVKSCVSLPAMSLFFPTPARPSDMLVCTSQLSFSQERASMHGRCTAISAAVLRLRETQFRNTSRKACVPIFAQPLDNVSIARKDVGLPAAERWTSYLPASRLISISLKQSHARCRRCQPFPCLNIV